MADRIPDRARRGRGAVGNPAGRFERFASEPVDDGWHQPGGDPPPVATSVTEEACRKIVSRNASPDIPFDRSINPYRGCEHGCVYCYARPTHAYLGLSSGLDFETRLFAKVDAAEALRRELSRPGYRPAPIMLGANTDPYQPIERRYAITRGVLEVLAETRHPVAITTKSALVLRDLDLLAAMARRHLAAVAVSVTTLDPALARPLEPRAASPARRLETIAALSTAGIPVSVMAAPMIPALNDHELEAILAAAADAGATAADYTMLRLPYELKALFTGWLQAHAPGRAGRVLNQLRGIRRGGLNVATFGERMKGEGQVADLLRQRFDRASRRLGLDRSRAAHFRLDTGQFCPPTTDRQYTLL